MFTKMLWNLYIEFCVDLNCGLFVNDYFALMFTILASLFTLVLDILLSPLEIITLIIGKLIERNID